MKKLVVLLVLAVTFLTSCGDKKKEEVKQEVGTEVEAATENVATATDNIELGKKLFTEKTCVACHNPDMKVIGPSIKDINKIYTEKGADIVAFLKEQSPAIVDTDPAQVAIMKTNLDGFVKNMTDTELAAIAAYMKSVN